LSDNYRVLVVEDELDTAQTVALLLKAVGHEVQFAISAAAARECAERFRPQVALIDVVLADGDGCDLAREMKRDPGLSGLRVVVMTGYDNEPLRRRAARAGCDCYLVKPLDLAALDRAIRAR
jgi:two-component system CheB/CheR fusion protein